MKHIRRKRSERKKGVGDRSLAQRGHSASTPKAGAECASPARSDLCGGRRETGVPTAIPPRGPAYASPYSKAIFVSPGNTYHIRGRMEPLAAD